MKLLARPAPAAFESWPAYLHRLAQHNHLHRLHAIARLLDITPERLLASNPGDVLKQLGVRPGATEDIVLLTPNQPPGRAFLARAGRTLRTRMCPACLRDDRNLVIPAEWEGAFSFTCSRHHIALLELCPACGSSLTYDRDDLTRCRCGHALWMADRQPVAPSIDQVSRVLALTQGGTLRSAFAPSTEKEVHASWLIRRLAIINSSQFQVRKATRFASDAFITTVEVLAVSEWFVDWPNGFLSQLGTLQNRHHLAPSQIIGSGLSALSSHLPAVAEAMREFDRRRRTGKRPIASSISGGADTSTMGIKQLMTQTGCCYGAVHNWIRFGWLGEVRREPRPRGDTLYFIEMPMALRAIAMVKKTAGIRQMAREIGVEPDALRGLVQANVLSSVPFGVASWNVRVFPSEVFELTRSLLDAAVRGIPSSAETISISTALRLLRKRDPSLIAPFVDHALRGKLRTRKFIASSVTLDEITLRKDEFASWLRTKRG